ncbi:MAG: valine--tRNA ligase [Patescibacteria group bacterium]|nr:valine--tRNA ligase [Patescibacteria group bacterium]
MDKNYQPNKFEEKIYNDWEKNGFFEAKINTLLTNKKKQFSIILPPPNANANLHLGHAMYVYEDIMIRYHKLLGEEVLWLPGADHAGFETQFVFEKELKKQGKSRFDYDRETLFKMIWDFVMKNRDNMENQLRRLGFFLDWSKKKFTMDDDIVEIVYDTFKKLFNKGLVYRDEKLVNYCTFCGTSFSDLEVIDKERNSILYYIKYPFVNKKNDEYLVVATTRPETLLGDTAVAVNPKDRRYKKLIGEEVIIPFVERKVRIIADNFVDPKFGTGAVKITPAHDFNDFEIGKKHNLDLIQVINFDGKLNENAGEFKGLYVSQAREAIVLKLKEKNLIEKIEENYKNIVGTCYKCGRVLEPLPKEQWFVKIAPLAQKAKEFIKKEKIKIIPKRFKKILLWWFDNFKDWNISRQIVWGIRIPAYKCNSKLKTKNNWFISTKKPDKCQICGDCDFKQDTDTFDTWFSSGQWPYAVLLTQNGNPKSQILNSKKNQNNFFNYFYPTSVMETGYDILPWWVARMIMLGIFYTGKEPFKTIYLHGLVRDKYGQKMSKSKGNVINPMEMIDKYGADALRGALIFEVGEGADLSFSEEKVIAMRNFCNKIWNIGRFININIKNQILNTKNKKLKILKQLNKEFKTEKKKYFKLMNNYHFSRAFGLMYEFLWHRLADFYIEQLKTEITNGNINALESLKNIYLECLIMLHPFFPFITEVLFKIFKGEDKSILKTDF